MNGKSLATIVALLLAACGGGGDGGSNGSGATDAGPGTGATQSSPQGLYQGTAMVPGVNNGRATTLVTEKDDVWVIFDGKDETGRPVVNLLSGQGTVASNTVNAPAIAVSTASSASGSSSAGGNGNSSNSSSSSSSGASVEVSLNPDGTISGTATVSGSTTGTGANATATATFNGTTITQSTQGTTTATARGFEQPAKLSDLQGTWIGILLDGHEATLTIAADGTFAGTSAACHFSGTATPSAQYNYFVLRASFDQNCRSLANMNDLRGIAAIADDTLYGAVLSPDRSHGMVFIGKRT